MRIRTHDMTPTSIESSKRKRNGALEILFEANLLFYDLLKLYATRVKQAAKKAGRIVIYRLLLRPFSFRPTWPEWLSCEIDTMRGSATSLPKDET